MFEFDTSDTSFIRNPHEFLEGIRHDLDIDIELPTPNACDYDTQKAIREDSTHKGYIPTHTILQPTNKEETFVSLDKVRSVTYVIRPDNVISISLSFTTPDEINVTKTTLWKSSHIPESETIRVTKEGVGSFTQRRDYVLDQYRLIGTGANKEQLYYILGQHAKRQTSPQIDVTLAVTKARENKGGLLHQRIMYYPIDQVHIEEIIAASSRSLPSPEFPLSDTLTSITVEKPEEPGEINQITGSTTYLARRERRGGRPPGPGTKRPRVAS
jgi:hypothetical protein